MYLAGFSFQVLSNSFVVHKGFKERGKFHTDKEEENRRNFQLFQNDFIPEMSKKYSTADRECLEFSRREGKAKVTFRHHFNKHSKEKMSRAEKQVEL
uniref:Beta-1,4-glucuronyltransferase 1 n=1 Tax=Ciona savignyi TaxID=51511 RepID=H2Y9I1_CIOSA